MKKEDLKEDLEDVKKDVDNLENEDYEIIDEEKDDETILDEEIIEEEEIEENEELSEESEDSSEVSDEENINSELESLKDQLLRLQADFSNYKRRTDLEKKEYMTLGIKKLAMDILPVLDNLSLALVSVSDHTGDKGLIEGFDLIDDQLMEVLKKHDIVEIEAEGQKFDPNFHYAVGVVEDSDLDSDIVVDVLQKGYKIKNEVIRPSMVRVSK